MDGRAKHTFGLLAIHHQVSRAPRTTMATPPMTPPTTEPMAGGEREKAGREKAWGELCCQATPDVGEGGNDVEQLFSLSVPCDNPQGAKETRTDLSLSAVGRASGGEAAGRAKAGSISERATRVE